MISMDDLVAIGVETLRINSGCFLEKEIIELIIGIRKGYFVGI